MHVFAEFQLHDYLVPLHVSPVEEEVLSKMSCVSDTFLVMDHFAYSILMLYLALFNVERAKQDNKINLKCYQMINGRAKKEKNTVLLRKCILISFGLLF